MDTLILGAGTMGRWLGGLDLGTITYADRDPAAAAAAAATADRATDTELSGSYDLICVAVPMSAATGAIRRASRLDPAAIVDVTGEMAGPLAALERYHPSAQRASFHPLFAPANAPGAVAAVTAVGGQYTDRFVEALETAGNTVFETTAADHDDAMETIQAAAHTAILAYGLAADTVPDEFETPISRTLEGLREQVTDGDPAVYAEIQDRFDGAERVAAAAQELADADRAAFEDLFEAARHTDSTDHG